MITGFNTDVEHEGVVYHVQTEDKGLKSPLILSLVYSGGAILASKRTPYEDLIASGFDEAVLSERLKRQHKLICAAIRAGRVEDLKQMAARDAQKVQGPGVSEVLVADAPSPPELEIVESEQHQPTVEAPEPLIVLNAQEEFTTLTLEEVDLPQVVTSQPEELVILGNEQEEPSTIAVESEPPVFGVPPPPPPDLIILGNAQEEPTTVAVESEPPVIIAPPAPPPPDLIILGNAEEEPTTIVAEPEPPKIVAPSASQPPEPLIVGNAEEETTSIRVPDPEPPPVVKPAPLHSQRRKPTQMPAQPYVVFDSRRESEPQFRQGLNVSLLSEYEFRSGDTVKIGILVTNRAGRKQKPLAGVSVSVKILGTTFRPIILTKKTENDGVVVVKAEIPRFSTGRAAILVRAEDGADSVEIRRVVRPEGKK